MSRRLRPAAVHPFDQRHGTETSGLLPGEVIARGTGFAADELTAYYGVAPSILDAIVALWLREGSPRRQIERTVFLDVGAGKGRAMLVASRHPFLRVEGVELNAALAAVARSNLTQWAENPGSGALAPVRLQEGDATRMALPEEPTVAFLFHPFEAKLLRRFVRHVLRSQKAAPRPFDLLYVNAEHGALLDAERGLQCVWRGRVPMSTEDHLADLAAIAEQKEYGSTGDETCAIYRALGDEEVS